MSRLLPALGGRKGRRTLGLTGTVVPQHAESGGTTLPSAPGEAGRGVAQGMMGMVVPTCALAVLQAEAPGTHRLLKWRRGRLRGGCTGAPAGHSALASGGGVHAESPERVLSRCRRRRPPYPGRRETFRGRRGLWASHKMEANGSGSGSSSDSAPDCWDQADIEPGSGAGSGSAPPAAEAEAQQELLGAAFSRQLNVNAKPFVPNVHAAEFVPSFLRGGPAPGLPPPSPPPGLPPPPGKCRAGTGPAGGWALRAEGWGPCWKGAGPCCGGTRARAAGPRRRRRRRRRGRATRGWSAARRAAGGRAGQRSGLHRDAARSSATQWIRLTGCGRRLGRQLGGSREGQLG